ncbi:M15 family metallopeptidase, partial [Lacticaseibacillus paracasei]
DKREALKHIYININNQLPKGVRLRFTHTLRTIEEQNYLYSQGRIRSGSIVTNAKGGQSIHNYGLAFDIVILLDEDKNGNFEKA